MTHIKEFVQDNAPEGFEDSKFSILCEKEPIVGTYNIKAKALYIIYKNNDGETAKIYPADIEQPYFDFTETNRRKLVNKKKPFWINGNTTIQHYNEHEYINYSIEIVKKSEEDKIKAFRKKYNITEPNIYEGENLGLEF